MRILKSMNLNSVDNPASESTVPQELIDRLIAEISELDGPPSPQVESALRAVPRHLFVPEVSMEQAYAEDAVVTKRDADGVSISSVSSPRIIAMMLDQLQVQPGHRVLEVGSGGYNAALLAELVGSGGQVTSVDIDPEVVERARRCLTAAGCASAVTVACVDGEFGCPERGPFDRIVVTVGAWDIPPAWVDQLAPGGRLVVPLDLNGVTRSVVFEREAGYLASRGYEMCGFVPMQGAGEQRAVLVRLHDDEVGLRLNVRQQVDADALRTALTEPRVAAWSGVLAGKGGRFDGLYLWFAMFLPGYCHLMARQSAVDSGIVAHAWPVGVPTVVAGGSFAYLTFRRVAGESDTYEYGVYAHGPDAATVADRMIGCIRDWDGNNAKANITVHPADTPDEHLPAGVVLNKRHARVTVSWP